MIYRDSSEFSMYLNQMLTTKDLRKKMGCGASHEHELKYSEKATLHSIQKALRIIIDASFEDDRNKVYD